jgi:hypothetical protein
MKTCILAIVFVLAETVIAQDNPCNICPDGPTAGSENTTPLSSRGDNRTCSELIEDAVSIESGTNECGAIEVFHKIACCPPTEIANPCNMCPNGITAGDDHLPASWPAYTCKALSDFSEQHEAGSDGCGYYDVAVPDCCPPGATISPTTTPITTSPSTAPQTPYPTSIVTTPAPTNENQCVVCRKGIIDGYESHVPYAPDDTRTCVEIIDDGRQLQAGVDACAWAELDENECCYNYQAVDPCNICPNGVTDEYEDVTPFEQSFGDSRTCRDMSYEIGLYEADSDYCRVHGAYCCPSVPVTTLAPSATPVQVTTLAPVVTTATRTTRAPIVLERQEENKGKVNAMFISTIAISSAVGITLLGLAVYFLRKRASATHDTHATNPGVVQMPEGDIPTAVAMPIDPESANTPPTSVWQTKMRPQTSSHAHASAPPSV